MLLYLCTWFDFKLDHLFSMRVIIFAITVGKGSGGKPGNKEVASSPSSLIEKVSHVSGRLLCFTLIATEKARSKLK